MHKFNVGSLQVIYCVPLKTEAVSDYRMGGFILVASGTTAITFFFQIL